MIGLGEHVILNPLLPPSVVAVLTVVLAAGALVAPWRWSGALRPRRRGVLIILRLLVVAAVALLMLRPRVRWPGSREVPAEVAVLLDASRSMGIRDAGPGALATRAKAVSERVASSGEAFAALGRRAAIRPYAFGSRVRASGGLSVEPADPRTDLAQALRFVSARAAQVQTAFSPRLAAVVVVSDGRFNRSIGGAAAAARELAGRNVAVHTVVVGSTEPTGRVRDVAVRGLRAPERVFAGNKAETRATVATLGLKGRTLEVVLTVDGKETARRRITPPGHRTVQEVVFAPTLDETGPARLALAVEPLEGELVTTNNRAETTVRVQEGGIRVLYLDGRLHPEGKYLARVLRDAREIDLSRRVLVGAGSAAAAPGPADLDGLDVVILGDLPADALPRQTVERLAGGIRAGEMSVLTLGGLSAYGPGGWAGAALADLLPFAVRPEHGQVAGPVPFRLTPEGREHFVFRRDEEEAAPTVDDLPPLSGANAVGDLRPGARLLAQAPDGAPLLAVREFGEARVASATVDTTWRWALAPEETGGPETHRRLWRRLVLWLARRDGRPRDDLWVMTDRTRYVIIDRDRPPVAEVTVGVKGDERPRVRIEGPAALDVSLGQRSVGSPNRSEWRGTALLREPGDYRVVVEVSADGETKRAETSVTVGEQDFELVDLLADADRLGRIAEAGGGTCQPLDRLPDLLARLARSLEPRQAPAERHVSLAGGRVFLAVVVALLAAEWVLRRRWGLA